MTSPYYILDDNGEPVHEPDFLKWGVWFESTDRHVGDDEIGAARVSTVFLGLDHAFGAGPPVLFETMIFGGPHHEYQDRYRTRAEALTGHRRVLEMVRSES